jgi:hypothetical protein
MNVPIEVRRLDVDDAPRMQAIVVMLPEPFALDLTALRAEGS